MICWCKKVESYICSECEKKKVFKPLSRMDKIDLLAYKKKLIRGETDLELAKRILNKGHCVSMVPSNNKI